MPPTSPHPLHVIVLGNDAVLAARPATPTQVARACLELDFDLVVPVSWGEELLAMRVVEATRGPGPAAVVVAHCPFVAEALRADASPHSAPWTGVAPPVAAARYVRAAFADREVRVTYAGRCPGATAPDVDERVLPEVLLGRLVDGGVVPDEQPDWFDAAIPPDRARYASLPGGIPAAGVLAAATGAELREAAPATLDAVSRPGPEAGCRVIDLEVATGCVCARARRLSEFSEPPRSAWPVVRTDVQVDLSLQPGPGRLADVPVVEEHATDVPPAMVEPEPSLWFDHSRSRGPADGSTALAEAVPPSPASPAGPVTRATPIDAFVDTVEPWNRPSAVDAPRMARPASPKAPAGPAVDPAPAAPGRYAFSLNTPEAVIVPRSAAYDWLRTPIPPSVDDAFATLERERRRERRLQAARRTGVLLAVVALTVGGALGAQWLVARGTFRAAPAGAQVQTSPDATSSDAVEPAADSIEVPATSSPETGPRANRTSGAQNEIEPD